MTERNEVSRNWAADLAICEAATAGLWYIPKLKYEEDYQIYTNVNGVKIAAVIPTDKHDDGRFIAEARTGWPAALTEIERLTSVLARFDDRTNPMLPRSEMARIAKEALDETVGYAVDDAEIRRLRVENRRYRQALVFYAAESTYDVEHLDKHGYLVIDDDNGNRAREALSYE